MGKKRRNLSLTRGFPHTATTHTQNPAFPRQKNLGRGCAVGVHARGRRCSPHRDEYLGQPRWLSVVAQRGELTQSRRAHTKKRARHCQPGRPPRVRTTRTAHHTPTHASLRRPHVQSLQRLRSRHMRREHQRFGKPQAEVGRLGHEDRAAHADHLLSKRRASAPRKPWWLLECTLRWELFSGIY